MYKDVDWFMSQEKWKIIIKMRQHRMMYQNAFMTRDTWECGSVRCAREAATWRDEDLGTARGRTRAAQSLPALRPRCTRYLHTGVWISTYLHIYTGVWIPVIPAASLRAEIRCVIVWHEVWARHTRHPDQTTSVPSRASNEGSRIFHNHVYSGHLLVESAY